MSWEIENGRLKNERGFTLADMRYVGATPEVKKVIRAAPDMLAAHEQIIALASGWDENGALGPKEPMSWESVARLAMDIAQAAKAKAEGRYKQHVTAIAKAERGQ